MFFMMGRTLAPYLLLLVVLGGSLGLPPGDFGVTVALAVEDASSGDRQMAEALKSYQRGAFEEAAAGWTEAARLYEQAGKLNEQSEALIFLTQAYQSMGHYIKALQSLQAASALVERTGDRSKMARIKGIAGTLYLASGQPEDASRNLKEGLQLAKEAGNAGLAAVILNDRGNVLASQKKYDEALAAYTESISLAQATENHALLVQVLINAATASLQSGRHQDARDRLDQALKQVRALEDSYDKAYSLISIGLTYNNLRPHLPDTNGALMLQAFESLNEAVKVAAAIENPRAASYAWGYLGSLYETERRYEEALDLTRRAVMAAQQAVAPEALYRWYWQTGRLFKALGKREDAIAAYRLAVPALQSIRPEMLLTSGAEPPHFRESVGPLFFELADLLLQQAASIEERARSEPYLREARDAIEQFKVAELRDYFRDECVDAARTRVKGLETVSRTAAVVYPILLPDRLEILVSLATGLQRVSVPVKAENLTQEIRAFRKKLEKRTTQEYLPYAQQLYGWLIRPIEPVLASLPIDTLVFVPDGPLLTIPMAALHDGKQFLISRYAVAITPGLTLTDPRPLKRKAIKALSVGLTESVRNFPPLPNVAEELDAIQRLYPGTLLLNKEFLVPRVEKELTEGLCTIMHVASYRQLQDSSVSKAVALQRAQLKMLEEPAYDHPAYWAPFLLLNNWL